MINITYNFCFECPQCTMIRDQQRTTLSKCKRKIIELKLNSNNNIQCTNRGLVVREDYPYLVEIYILITLQQFIVDFATRKESISCHRDIQDHLLEHFTFDITKITFYIVISVVWHFMYMHPYKLWYTLANDNIFHRSMQHILSSK